MDESRPVRKNSLSNVVRRNIRRMSAVSTRSQSSAAASSHGVDSNGVAAHMVTAAVSISDQDMEDADLLVVKKCLGLEEDDEDADDLGSGKSVAPSSKSVNTAIFPSCTCCCTQFFMWLAEHNLFVSIFMTLTFYALFAPDMDMLFGDKTSRQVFLILNTVVCAAFIFEVVVMSFGKDGYFLRPYFFLDLVALVSMIPDTWVVQQLMQGGGGFVAGRSSRIARIIRVASRSSKATRMNRVTRIARVASLLPKLGKLVGHHANEQEVKIVLSKKLNRVFRLFDDDMDGRVARAKVTKFLNSLKTDIVRASHRRTIRGSLAVDKARMSESASPSDHSEHEAPQRLSHVTDTSGSANDEHVRPKSRVSEKYFFSINDDEDDGTPVGFQEFSEMLLEDSVVGPCLKQAVDLHLKRRTNTKNITTKHSEYVAVRVALGVILTLFLTGLAAPAAEDNTLEMGLDHLVETTRLNYPNTASGSVVPEVIHKQFNQFAWNREDDKRRNVLWLDVMHFVYCNAFTYGEKNCTRESGATTFWGYRESLKKIRELTEDANYRLGDLVFVRIGRLRGDIDDVDISDDEMNFRTVAFAIVERKGDKQKEAAFSIATTCVIIIIILAGIGLLTQDLTQMSSQLLKPLRELTDDMESLTQLQLAGAEDAEEERKLGKGTDEIRQIRNTFEKMKKAIKSWGKYVPWPVVQMMLRANVEADLKVEEVEASMYFSDIAGFTTIVEKLQPEKSLLLLNRYFNDMTKVIDDHGGVVIEFIGDAIFCIYGAPLVNPYHPSAAVKGALRMLAVLKKLNAWSVTKGLPEVGIRCGVHTGNVLVGNMGFQTRMKYGIVGEDSQMPSRLEELNKTYSSKCLTSASTYSRLVENMFIARPVDFIKLRQAPGSEPELIYEVMDRERTIERTNPLWEVVDLHTEAMDHYMCGEFEEAIDKFQEVGQMVKQHRECEVDGPSELLIKRCESYLKEPPPEGWDGVWTRGG